MPNDVVTRNTKRSSETNQLMLNNVLTGITVLQNRKINSSLQELKIQTQAQTQHLVEISKSQSEMLQKQDRTNELLESQTKKQDRTNELLEEQAIEKRLNRAAKDVVFNFKKSKDQIANQPTNLERYFNAANCLENFKQTGINYEDLPDISDKEFLYQSIKDLEKICSDSLKTISDEEVDDLSKLDRFNTEIALISRTKNKIEEEKKKTDKTIKDLRKQLADELEKLPTEKRFFETYRREIIMVVTGIVGLFLASFGNPASGDTIAFVIMGSVFLLIVGFVMGITRLLREIFKKRRNSTLRKTIMEGTTYRESLIEDAKKSFEEYLQKTVKETKREFDIKKWSSFFEDELKTLEKEFKTTLAKYPSLDIKVKE